MFYSVTDVLSSIFSRPDLLTFFLCIVGLLLLKCVPAAAIIFSSLLSKAHSFIHHFLFFLTSCVHENGLVVHLLSLLSQTGFKIKHESRKKGKKERNCKTKKERKRKETIIALTSEGKKE